MFEGRVVVIGADPDLNHPAIGMVDARTGEPLAVACVQVQSTKTDHGAVVDCIRAARGCFRSLLQKCDEPTVAAIAVEGQEIAYTSRSGKNPRSILFLGCAAGGLLAEAGYETQNILMPSPKQWKGDVPKAIHQARTLQKLGWAYETVGSDSKTGYCRPSGEVRLLGAKDIRKSDWKHVVDALGLALWAQALIAKEQKR